MVTLPQYKNQHDQDELTEHMRDQAIFDEHQELYYFRVREEQYNELTKNYFRSIELARKTIKDVTFTYEELFGE